MCVGGRCVVTQSINTINDIDKVTMIDNINIQSTLKIGKGKGFKGEDIGKIQISSKKLTEFIGQTLPVTVILTVDNAYKTRGINNEVV